MKDQQKRTSYYSKRLKQLENLPDDNPIKKKWKSGEISDNFAIYCLELEEFLEEY